MKTLLGTEIPKSIRGVVYLCHFDSFNLKITVENELLCTSSLVALEFYSEIPNPESQLAMGSTYEKLCAELEKLHKNMKDEKWLQELSEQL